MNEEQREVAATVTLSPDAAGASRRRSRSLRVALGRLILAVLLPFVAAGVAFLVQQWHQHRTAAVASLEDHAHNLQRAVDRELSLDLAVLRGLAASNEIDRRDWRAFHALAADAAQVRPGSWIALYEPGGQNLVNTRVPLGTPLPNLRQLRSARADAEWEGRKIPLLDLACLFGPLEHGRPCFSGLVYGVVTRRPAVGTIVAVVRTGKPVYVLALVYSSQFFEELLRTERAPNLTTGIWDQRGLFVARSRDSETFVGRPGPAPFNTGAAHLSLAGMGESLNVESIPYVYAFRRSTVADYVVSAGMPKAAVLAPAWRALWMWLCVLASAAAVGAFFAVRLWRRVGTPLVALAQQARSPVDDAHGDVAANSEIEEVEALREALRDRRRAEAAFRGSEARLRLALDAAKFGTFELDIAKGHLVWDVPKKRMWGISEGEEFRYPAVLDQLHPEDRGRVAEAVEASFRTGEYESEYRVIWPDRSVHWLYARGRVEFHQGKPARMLGVELDITDRKLVEEALRDANEKFRAVNEKLREADRKKDEFLGMLSHELRNPLAPIRSSAYVLRHADPSSPQADRARTVIERQTEHLTRIVDDLLDVTRIARGKIVLHRNRVDLREVVRLAVGDAHLPIENRGVRLHLNLPESQLWADADATRITQIVGNLLANARKFTHEGDEVVVTLREVDATAELTVRDTGAGIDPALLPHLFDAFVQGERTLARSEGGLGLGLALVKGLVALHGGSVEARSAGIGRGAEFVVRLPLVGPLVNEQPSRGAPRRAAKARHVLVVDDNADAAESLAELVSLFGHSVEVAYDGPSAIEKARQRRPDVVLCDIGLPGMTGYEVAQALRSEHDGVLRLVAVSGYAQAQDVEKATAAGFDAHVAKPPDPETIGRLLS